MKNRPELSVVLPAQDEEKAIGQCLKQIKEVLAENSINGEIIVSDSSTDKTAEIAKSMGVKVICHGLNGYGRALLKGFNQASGQFIFMADADGSYDFRLIPDFLNEIKNKNLDLVIGNRFAGQIESNAMPTLHRYLGRIIFSNLSLLFFGQKVNDIHCGMRMIRANTLTKLNLKTSGMEFASEMIVKAFRQSLKLGQLPINYQPRLGQSKLKSARDGWRHLRFMLLYSPNFLFLLPGFIMFTLGIVTLVLLYFKKIALAGIVFQYHPMFVASLLVIIGYQLIIFSVFAKIYAHLNLNEKDDLIEYGLKHLSLEKSLLIGSIPLLAGILIFIVVLYDWLIAGLGELNAADSLIIGLTLIAVGTQTIFSSFMLSIIGIK